MKSLRKEKDLKVTKIKESKDLSYEFPIPSDSNLEAKYHELFDSNSFVATGLTEMITLKNQIVELQRKYADLEKSIPNHQQRIIELQGEVQDLALSCAARNLTDKDKKALDGCDFNAEMKKSFTSKTDINFKKGIIKVHKITIDLYNRLKK